MQLTARSGQRTLEAASDFLRRWTISRSMHAHLGHGLACAEKIAQHKVDALELDPAAAGSVVEAPFGLAAAS
eukprot:3646998-Rhodomonas_salina.2